MDTITLTNAQGRSVSVAYDWEQGRLAGCTVSDAAGSPLFSRTQTRALRRPALVTIVTNAGIQPLTSDLSPLTFSYAYDGLGRPVERGTDRFDYNARGEVVSATIGTNAATYAYDSIGNRETATAPSGTTAYTANALNQYTAVNSWTPSYDADGDLLGDGVHDYTWDAAGRLSSVTNAAMKLEFAYDWKGRRTRRAEYQRNGAAWDLVETRTFVYDDWNLIYERGERPGESAAELVYFWGPDLSGSLQGAGGVGGLVAVSVGGNFYFPGYDNNGNVIGYWDENGSLVAEYAYDAFGNTLSYAGSMASVFPHRFSTKYCDAETDLYYYGYRYYSPSPGRWISRDPIEETGGNNLYCFSDNAPCLRFDDLGLFVAVFSGAADKDNEKKTLDMIKLITDGKRIASNYEKALKKHISKEVYSSLQNKGKVLFNGRPFTESFQKYLEQIHREQHSFYFPSTSPSIESLVRRMGTFARFATEPYDYVGLALHGEFDQENDRPYNHVLFSGGGNAEQMNRMQFYRLISSELTVAGFGGAFVLISCYQEWYPQYDSFGRLKRSNSEQFTETFNIETPTTAPSAEEFSTNPNADPCELSFDPFKLIHIVGDEK